MHTETLMGTLYDLWGKYIKKKKVIAALCLELAWNFQQFSLAVDFTPISFIKFMGIGSLKFLLHV